MNSGDKVTWHSSDGPVEAEVSYVHDANWVVLLVGPGTRVMVYKGNVSREPLFVSIAALDAALEGGEVKLTPAFDKD